MEGPRDDEKRTARLVSRRAGDDGAAFAEAPADARLRSGATDQAQLERFAASGRRLALPRPAAAPQRRTGEGGMGRFGDEPARANLQIDAGGSEPFAARSLQLRKNARRNHARARAGGIMSWVKRLFARRRMYGDLSAEIREHLEEKIEELVAEGMPRTQAEAKARKEFGNVTLMEERGREVWQWPRLESFFADVRYGLRMLRKSPGFTAVAVLTLALGIGANTAIFTLVDALYLKPLAVNHPEQIVRIYAAIPGRSYNEGFSDPEFRLLREKASSFSALAAETQIAQLHVVVNGDSEELRGAFVSANYFSLLGVGAQQGRTFLATEDGAPGGDAVAVVSNQFWKAHFGSDLAAIGAEIHINGIPFKIVGIAPPGFYGDIAGMPAQLWLPTSMLGACGYGCADGSYRCAVYDAIVGRLARGNSASGAQAELRGRIVWSATNWPQRPSLRRIIAAPANGVSPDQRAESDSQMRLLMAVTASLLLIACANLAGLLLARGAARKKEIALRLCIGASRTRVARQLFTESLLLAAGGGILGLWFSFGARNVLSGFYATDSEGFHHLYDLNFDWRILAYSMSIAILASVFFGLLPAIRAPRQDLVSELKDGASSGEFAGGWLRRGLVIAQVALSMTLVVSAGLLVRSGLAIEHGTNFDPRHMAVLRLRPELIHYTPQQVASLVRRAMQAVETMPGVESAAFMEGGEGLVWNPQNGHEVPISVPGESQVTPAAGLRVQD